MVQSKSNQTLILTGVTMPKPKGKEVMPPTQNACASQATVPKGALEGKKLKFKNMHPPMPEKDLEGRMQLHRDLECMGCSRLMSSPWNLANSNRIIMEIVGEVEVEEKWKLKRSGS